MYEEYISGENPGFRPLDGESFSKLHPSNPGTIVSSFRPLDGESFSKLVDYLDH